MKTTILAGGGLILFLLTLCSPPAIAQWQQSGNNIYYTNGNVGVGTSNPAYLLHVETSLSSRAIFGRHTASSGASYGGWFESASTAGMGVFGLATASSGYTYGVYGRSYSSSGKGVVGHATATSGGTYGGWFQSESTDGKGVRGVATATTGYTYGGLFESASNAGIGVAGLASASSGYTYGVSGQSNSPDGAGVYGYGSSTSGSAYGGYFRSNSSGGTAVYGTAPWTGIYGYATATPDRGQTFGVYGRSDSVDGRGVYGYATASWGGAYGVYGRSNSTGGAGVYGYATANVGVLGQTDSSSSYGVYSAGNLAASGTKSFQIDHPLKPDRAYLNHFCTEGPEPYNAYSGNITTDAQGYAVVQLPDYFEAINRDFRYQLTVIDSGDDFVLAKVVRKIQNNQFVIRTSKPYTEVSWRVEAIRNDRWVQEYGFLTEQMKPKEQQGKYLHPELYGQPKEMSILHQNLAR